ncbi:camphor resistance protein CrcB [Actinacidiphila yanglinensis]|uniref:Fluoride-specific ion channel FluC n=1 Tax=Actinacidiphila yanglinensis TaxID=310779 RepID=A0A1H6DY05_9ACTN|nr:camphor resistance protein CrcB [Actinacidiphila yanglinensis]
MADPRPPLFEEPVDSDVDLHVPGQRAELSTHPATVLAVIAVGGAIGACARYGAALLWPTATDAFPWTTFGVNAVGCAVIGVFMVLITDVWTAHPLVRPFFGTGVLGGFTTFSTYASDVRGLVDHGHPRPALGYLALTAAVALAAVWAGANATRRVVAATTGREVR